VHAEACFFYINCDSIKIMEEPEHADRRD